MGLDGVRDGYYPVTRPAADAFHRESKLVGKRERGSDADVAGDKMGSEVRLFGAEQAFDPIRANRLHVHFRSFLGEGLSGTSCRRVN